MKRQKIIEGSLFKIPLSTSEFIYGRIASAGTIVVYDSKTSNELGFEKVAKRDILFRIYVADAVFKRQISTRWQIVGVYTLEEKLLVPPKFFMQNIADHSKLQVYEGNNIFKIATFEECKGLERFSVWMHENVVERIYDHYEGNTLGIAYRSRLKTIEEPTMIEIAQESLEKENYNIEP
jgi:hypothetical protein